MGREVILFESEEPKEIQSVADFLRQLADKLDEQKVVLRDGQNEVSLEIPSSVVLEIKAEEEEKKQKTQRSLEIEIEWIVGQEGTGGVSLG